MRKLCMGLLILMAPVSVNAQSSDVFGLWLTQAKDGHIDVKDCGDGTPCGTLVWVNPEIADTNTDARNANKSLRERSLIGVPIVWGYSRGQRDWRKGHIYNPEDGKTFKSAMRLQDDGTLRVQGCLGPFCITNIWTPVPKQTKGE